MVFQVPVPQLPSLSYSPREDVSRFGEDESVEGAAHQLDHMLALQVLDGRWGEPILIVAES